VRIILYIVWALFVAAAVRRHASVRCAKRRRREQQITAGWPKAHATVTGSIAGWTNGGGGSSRSRRFFPTYQFTDPHGTLFAGESDVSFAGKPVPGSLIEVAYNLG
jgi:hypothetical protein